MKNPMHGDIVAMARAAYHSDRPSSAVITEVLDRATRANKHRIEHKRMHPTCGDGSIMSAALLMGAGPEPRLSDPRYCKILGQCYQAIARLSATAQEAA